jgi:hypothetical protein
MEWNHSASTIAGSRFPILRTVIMAAEQSSEDPALRQRHGNVTEPSRQRH